MPKRSLIAFLLLSAAHNMAIAETLCTVIGFRYTDGSTEGVGSINHGDAGTAGNAYQVAAMGGAGVGAAAAVAAAAFAGTTLDARPAEGKMAVLIKRDDGLQLQITEEINDETRQLKVGDRCIVTNKKDSFWGKVVLPYHPPQADAQKAE